MIIDGLGSGKANVLLNLINQQDHIEKDYLYEKDLSKTKYEFLIKKREDAGIKHLDNPNPNAFIDCSMDVVYRNIDENNPSRKRKIFVFDDMIAGIISNKKFQAVVNELFFRFIKFFCSKRCQIKFESVFY